MVRNGFLTLAVVGLAACGGTTTTYAPNVYPALNGQNLVTHGAFTSVRSAQVATGGATSDAVNHSTNVSITFVSTSQVQVSLKAPGGSTSTYTLNDVGGGLFSDGATTPVTMRYSVPSLGSGSASHMLAFELNDASGTGFRDFTVGGNRTIKTDMPKTGGAQYNGVFTGYDGTGTPGTGPSVTGHILLTANFAGAPTVDGTLDQFLSGPLMGATFTFIGTPISNGTFASALTVGGTATANGTNFIDGAFYGPGAKEVGGVIRINTVGGNFGGVFGAQRP